MTRDKAFNVATALVDAGWDVQVYGSAAHGQSVIETGLPERWQVVVNHHSTVDMNGLLKLRELVDVVGLDVYFNPTGTGLWLQEKP